MAKKIKYNSSELRWELLEGTTVLAFAVGSSSDNPWDVNGGIWPYADGSGNVYTLTPGGTVDATAVSSDILEGKTAFARGRMLTGTLKPGSGSVSVDNIEFGYVNDDGKFQQLDLEGTFPQEDGDPQDIELVYVYATGQAEPDYIVTIITTASSVDIVEGKTAVLNGQLVTGSMPEAVPSVDGVTVTVPRGYIPSDIVLETEGGDTVFVKCTDVEYSTQAPYYYFTVSGAPDESFNGEYRSYIDDPHGYNPSTEIDRWDVYTVWTNVTTGTRLIENGNGPYIEYDFKPADTSDHVYYLDYPVMNRVTDFNAWDWADINYKPVPLKFSDIDFDMGHKIPISWSGYKMVYKDANTGWVQSDEYISDIKISIGDAYSPIPGEVYSLDTTIASTMWPEQLKNSTDLSVITTTADQVLASATYMTSAGKLADGAIQALTDTYYVPGSSDVIIPSEGKYCAENILVEGDSNLKSENIKEGITIFGVAGTLKETDLTNLTAGNIKYGVTINGVSGTFTEELSAPASSADIRSGMVAFVNGTRIQGTAQELDGMAPLPVDYRNITASGSGDDWYITVNGIPGGFHDGNTFIELSAQELGLSPSVIKSGTSVMGIPGTFTSDANATSSDILKDKIAYVDGQKVIGTYEGSTDSSEFGYITADGKFQPVDVTGNAPVISGNARTISEVYVLATGHDEPEYNVTIDTTATSDDIRAGKTAVLDGTLVTGTMPELGTTEYEAGAEDIIIPGGVFLTGDQIIKALSNSGNASVSYGYVTSNGEFQALDMSGAEPTPVNKPETMTSLVMYSTGVSEPDYTKKRSNIPAGSSTVKITIMWSDGTSETMMPISGSGRSWGSEQSGTIIYGSDYNWYLGSSDVFTNSSRDPWEGTWVPGPDNITDRTVSKVYAELIS